MDAYEKHNLEDWRDDIGETEYCVYCGDDVDLNMRHYEFNQITYETKILAVNPMPHDKLIVREGFIRRIEYICDRCLDDEDGND